MRFTLRVLLLLLAAVNAQKLQACDVCGSSVSSQSLGLLPQFSKHFAGVQYQFSSADSQHPSLFAGKADEKSKQIYNTVQIWGKCQLAKRIQLFAFVPYLSNSNAESLQTTSSKGLGDISLIANYAVPIKSDEQNKRLLLAGGGLKLPTGKFTGSSDAVRNGIPNVQTGTGSWDFLANVNYTLKKKTWGYNLDLSYTLTTANQQEYKFGNRFNSAATAFLWLGNKKLKIVPQTGVKFEYSLHDYDNYAKKWLNEKTGGSMAFATAGTQLFFKKLGFKTTVQLPIYQHFAGGYVHSGLRLETGLLLLF